MLIIAVFAVGVVGYRSLAGPDYDWFDALYFTAITLTTVGYGEIIDMAHNPAARAFTVALLLVGVGTFVYFVSNLTAFLVEGTLDHLWVRRKMQREIAGLDRHEIVCGAGRTGVHVARELIDTGRPFVLVEQDPDRLDAVRAELGNFPALLGDATADDVLRLAGIERAHGLVSCVSNDRDNLVITFSARLLKPGLRIVSRCIDPTIQSKVRRAGADAVVSPNAIGGLRMVSELVRPTAVTFMDVMMRDRRKGMRVEDLLVHPESTLDGVALRELRDHGMEGVLVVALHRGDEEWTFNPDGDSTLTAGTRVVFIGNAAARSQLEGLAAAPG